MKTPAEQGFFAFLDITSRKAQTQLATLAAVSGILNTLTLVILNMAARSFDDPQQDMRLFLMFGACVSLYLLTKRMVANRLTDLVQSAVYRYRTRVAAKVKDLRLLAFEDIGRNQILSILAENTDLIAHGAQKLAEGVPAGIMLFCSFVYMATLSMLALGISVACILAAIATIFVFVKSISEGMKEGIKKEEEFFISIHALLDGFKEMKMDHDKMANLYEDHLSPAAAAVQTKRVESDTNNTALQLYSQGYFYLLMSAIVFVVPNVSHMDADTIMAVTNIVLFIIGPIVVIIDLIPTMARANVAVGHLHQLEARLDLSLEVSASMEDPALFRERGFGQLRMRELRFAYPEVDGEGGFSVGPLDLTIDQGSIVFIRGGNGSGKSTFLKLLTGLYSPDGGKLLLDDTRIMADNLAAYRNLFGIVFTDFHLFDRFYGRREVDPAEVRRWLEILELTDKTGFEQGRFTNTHLSTGQRKRLALAAAILDDKPVYVFDEVAADQDPSFREFFYTRLLADLKAAGKTLVVVTHDEKYFDCCDKLLIMEFGKLRPGRADTD